MITIRPYDPQDRAACLAIMASNIPAFFAPEEKDEFAAFLDNAEHPYLVLEFKGQIVGCGGYMINQARMEAGLNWGMIHDAFHGRGLGRWLLNARLDAIRESGQVARVVIDTSQHSAPFFARFGFVETTITPNGYGPGLDQVDMTLALNTP